MERSAWVQGERAEVMRAAVSRQMVGLMKEHFGRGPVNVKTYLTDDYVLVVMAGGYTRLEATLMAAGKADAVVKQRDVFQEAMRARFVQMIEDVTGRTVRSFMSANDQEADAMAELFLLERAG